MFQQYVNGALAFSIKRGGLLYGEVGGDGNALVHAIYEPPQVRPCLVEEWVGSCLVKEVEILTAGIALHRPALQFFGHDDKFDSTFAARVLTCRHSAGLGMYRLVAQIA